MTRTIISSLPREPFKRTFRRRSDAFPYQQPRAVTPVANAPRMTIRPAVVPSSRRGGLSTAVRWISTRVFPPMLNIYGRMPAIDFGYRCQLRVSGIGKYVSMGNNPDTSRRNVFNGKAINYRDNLWRLLASEVKHLLNLLHSRESYKCFHSRFKDAFLSRCLRHSSYMKVILRKVANLFIHSQKKREREKKRVYFRPLSILRTDTLPRWIPRSPRSRCIALLAVFTRDVMRKYRSNECTSYEYSIGLHIARRLVHDVCLRRTVAPRTYNFLYAKNSKYIPSACFNARRGAH